jgi:hypothetical protein
MRFISKDPIPVTVDGQNVITIRPRMGYTLRQQVEDQMVAIRLDLKTAGDAQGTLHMGAYNVALLKANVTGWSGPDFAGRPYTPDVWDEVDPFDADGAPDPLIAAVLAEIAARNSRQSGAPDPNAPASGMPSGTLTASSSPSAPSSPTPPWTVIEGTSPPASPSANGTSMSPALSGTTGPLTS